MALNPNLSTATGKTSAGNLTETYVSAVDLLHTFDINPQLFDRYSKFGGPNFLTFFEDNGLAKRTDQSVYYHYEENWLQQGQKISASAVGTAGTGTAGSVNITIDPTSIDTTPSVRVGDLIIFKNNTFGYVTAITLSSG